MHQENTAYRVWAQFQPDGPTLPASTTFPTEADAKKWAEHINDLRVKILPESTE